MPMLKSQYFSKIAAITIDNGGRLKKKILSVLFAAIALSGCAASGKRYQEISPLPAAKESTNGRLTFFRTTATLAASGRDALITFNKGESRFCAYGGFTTIDANQGEHEISVGMKGSSENCEILVSAKQGEELFFEVKPNTDRILGESVTAGMNAGLRAKGIYGADSNSETKKRNCSGYFSVVPVDRDYALKQLESIRETKQ